MQHATSSEIYLELLSYVKAVSAAPLQVRGTPAIELEKLDEWVTFDILSIVDGPARLLTVEKYIDVQVICYSKHGAARSDKRFDGVYTLADKYNKAFHRKNLVIKGSCIQFKENRMVPLDLRSTGDFAKDILQQLPTLNIMSMVILNQGIISSYTEE